MPATRPHTVPKYVIYGFFFIGLVSAIAFRALIVLGRLEPGWVRPAWYIGTTGYVIFFLYRYLITRKRKHAIDDYRLIDKLKQNASLADDDREVMLYLLSSIRHSLEDLNYALIFLLSVIAVAADIALSLSR